MRVNVYSNELTDRIELVTTERRSDGEKFYGFRFYLMGLNQVPAPQGPDDDAPAVTFWFASTGERADFIRSLPSKLDGSAFIYVTKESDYGTT